jgi:hypothetical protein
MKPYGFILLSPAPERIDPLRVVSLHEISSRVAAVRFTFCRTQLSKPDPPRAALDKLALVKSTPSKVLPRIPADRRMAFLRVISPMDMP